MATEAEIKQYLSELVIEKSPLPDVELDPEALLDTFGLDSIDLVSMSADIEDFLGIELSPVILHEHPTINMLSKYLADSPT